MATYTYSITTDFLLVNEVDIFQLQTEILEETGITTTLTRIDLLEDDVDIVFVSSLSGGEETTLDDLIANYTNIVDEEEDLTEAFVQNNLSENKLLSGSASLKTGLTFNVTTCSYIINGEIYESDPGEITLDTADGSNPRIDVIVVNISGEIDKITGTPAADPEEKDVDDNTQIKVTAITVEAGASTPGTITLNNMYFENLGTGSGEWDATENTGGLRINIDSTNNPESGTKTIEVTGGQTDDLITLTNSETLDSSSISLLEFYLRSKATWDNTRRLKVAFYNGSTRVSEWVSVKNGTYDFQSIITTGYQIIVIPGTKFVFLDSATDSVRFKISGSGSNIGFYLDSVRLQGGLPLEDSATGEANTASNVGTNGIGLFKQKLGPDLEFYKINTTDPSLSLAVNSSSGSLDLGFDIGSFNLDWDDLTGTVDSIPFNTNLTKPSHSEGLVFYDKDEKTIAVYNDSTQVTHQLGQEGYIRVYNNSGSTISDGKPVAISGVEGVENRPTVVLGQADSLSTSEIIGITTQSIPNNSFGYVTYWGIVNDVDTSSFSNGDVLHLSDSVAGGYVTNAPDDAFDVQIGYVIKSDASGKILVQINSLLSALTGDADEVVVRVLKSTAGSITKGKVIYAVGFDNTEDVTTVELADASSSSTMPGFAIMKETCTNSTVGKAVFLGKLNGVDTSGYSVGDPLFVSETAGELTNTKPDGTALIQKIGKVIKVHASTGVIQVVGAGRSNDLPNIAETKFWLGNSNGVPTETTINDLTADASPDIANDSIMTWDNNAGLHKKVLLTNLPFIEDPGLAGDFVGTTDTQTLTNKTITDTPLLEVDNLRFDGNTISSTNTDGHILIIPNGSGEVRVKADPIDNLGVATKQYVDNASSGTSVKQAVQAKTVASLPAYTQSGTGIGATLTADANGAFPTIDGVTLSLNDRILVDSDGSASDVDNGIYTLSTIGDGSNPWVLTRATDADEDSEVISGISVIVVGGTASSGKQFIVTTSDPITVDTTATIWTELSTSSLTFSNIGSGGVGIYKQINGTTVELKNINAGSNKVSITDDTGDNEIDININEGNIVIGNLSGAPSGTVVGTTDTQTLSNKTLTLPKINDTSSSHSYNFAVNELTGDRTITLPLLTGNDTFVFENHTQTLTNKSLTTPTINGLLSITDTTQSTAFNNGAFTVLGGVGITKNLNVGGTFSVTNGATLSSTLDVGGVVNINDTTNSTAFNNGSLVVDGGVGIAKDVVLGSTTQSTNATTGALTVAGGVGITKNLNVKGATRLENTLILGVGTNGYSFPTSLGTENQVLNVNSGGNLVYTSTLTSLTLVTPNISTIINSGTLTLPTSTDTLVGRNTTDTLTNKTLTSPVISTIVNSGTLTLPNSTDVLVGRNTTDTLTNKTLTSPVISTISNTGTLTLPTSTDTLIGRNTTDTLTNKSIDANNNTITGLTSSDVGLGNVPNLKQNLTATSVPDSSNDNTEGYAVGSKWVDVTNDNYYFCVDASTGAAIWLKANNVELYDAVVAPTLQEGDYLLPSAAFAAGHKTVFVKNGTYNETSNINTPEQGVLIGESADGVQINMNGTSQITTPTPARTSYTGTVAISNGGTNVTGTSTTFDDDLDAGDHILLGNDYFEILSIASNTSLTLTSAYNGTAISGQAMSGQSSCNCFIMNNIKVSGNSTNPLLALQSVVKGSLTNVRVFAGTANNIEIFDSANCRLDFVTSKNSGGAGVRMVNCKKMILTSCNISNNGAGGLIMAGDSNFSDGVFSGCIIDNCYINNNTGVGMTIQPVSSGTIDYVKINTTECLRNTGKGIDIFSGSLRCSVDGCQLSFNGGDGIDFDGANCVVADTVIINNGGYGVQAGVNGVITGNQIENNGDNGINLAGDFENTVVGNRVISNTGFGISTDNARNVIGNNVVVSNTSDGINITDGDNNSVSNNIVYNNGGFGINISNSGATDNQILHNQVYSNTSGQYSDSGTTTLLILPEEGIYGTGSSHASDETTSQTTSSSFSQKLRLTTSSLSTGTYKITWYYEWQNTNTSGDFDGRIQINDSTTILEHRQESKDGGSDQWAPVSGFYYAEGISGVQNIDIDFANNGSGTARMRRARLEIIRAN